MLNGTLDDSLKKELIRNATIFDLDLAGSATVVATGAGDSSGGDGTFVSGETTGIEVTGGTGSNAICTVNMTDSTTISSIRVTTQGTGYIENDVIYLVNGAQQITLTLTTAMLKLFNSGTPGGGSGIWATVGTTTNQAVTKTSGTGAGGVVTVVTTSTTAIKSITVTTPATTDYVTGDTVELQGTLGDTIKITLTEVQAELLNGTASTALTGFVPTSPPLESGDKIRLKFTINSAAGQKDTKGHDISYAQSYYVDYQLS